MTIFNSNRLLFGESMLKLRGVNSIRLNILDENLEDIKALIGVHKDMLNGAYCEEVLKKLKNKGLNKGHLFRGV